MENAIIIIHAEDIQAAEQMVHSLDSYTVYVFDPILVDRIAASSLVNVEFVPWENAPAYASLYQKAHDSAYALEKELDTAREGILPEVSIYSWQHLTLYYLFMSLQWYNGMWNHHAVKLIGKKLHIFICDNPSIFYFNSFIPSLMLLQFARQHEVEFAGYTYGSKDDISTTLPNLRGHFSTRAKEFLLTHLPTCMYDMPYFSQEMLSSNKPIVNLRAKYFDMTVPSHATLDFTSAQDIAEELPAGLHQRIDALMTIVAARLDKFFERTLATNVFRERQITQLTNTYRSQILSYFLLNRYFETKKPRKILLSDHDTGLHGPLLAFAEQHAIDVRILPHSKTTPDLEFAYQNMHALVHPAQGDVILDRNHARIPHFKLAIPTKLQIDMQYPEPLKTVGLLLNAYSLNGIYFADYQKYFSGIKQIIDFCEKNELTLLVRCKPSYSVTQLLVHELGMDIQTLVENTKMPMAEYSKSCDICIMYDTPTAGALEFLAKSIPILNPTLGPLTRAQTVTTHPFTIPRESVGETLQRLASFKADSALLLQFKMNQFREYVDLFADAQPLRVFL